jgi:hypothetical protein
MPNITIHEHNRLLRIEREAKEKAINDLLAAPVAAFGKNLAFSLVWGKPYADWSATEKECLTRAFANIPDLRILYLERLAAIHKERSAACP